MTLFLRLEGKEVMKSRLHLQPSQKKNQWFHTHLVPEGGHQLTEVPLEAQWDFLHLIYSPPHFTGGGWVSPRDNDFIFFPFFLANWFLFVHHPPLVLCQWGRMFMTVCHFCSHSGIGTWLNAFCAFRWCRLKPTPISYAAKLHLSERLQKPVQIYVPCFWLALPIFYCHMFVSCRIGKEKHLSTVLATELFSQGSETRLSQWLRN